VRQLARGIGVRPPLNPGAIRHRGGVKAGDEVTVVALAARDGSNSGLLQELKMADGREFKFTPDPNGN
jgi:hypothetical protein